ncbi:MAG: amidophosphoribosyltransferase, partial [Oscillospiraceae bacterium]|nr:amidophosphoribosyltransferase [Oscillospiraceae bacterium]
MGGFFGIASKIDCVNDVFFGTDYHSHLGTRRGGMVAYNREDGFQRGIHSIENSPFRTKFENDIATMAGNICIGCISDTDPQPIILRSKLGVYAVCSIGIINNDETLRNDIIDRNSTSFEVMSSGKVNWSS